MAGVTLLLMTTNYLIPAECSTEGCMATPRMVIVHEGTKQHLVGCDSHWANIARILDGGDPIVQSALDDILTTAQVVNAALAAHAAWTLDAELEDAALRVLEEEGAGDDENSQ